MKHLPGCAGVQNRARPRSIMIERIENFDEVTPREVYNMGYDDAERHFREVIERIHLEYAAMRREREYLMKRLGEISSMQPPGPIYIVSENEQLSEGSE